MPINKPEKHRVLFLLHIPPPIHGSSIIGETIKKNPAINDGFNCSYINLLSSKKLDESGKYSMRKAGGFILTATKLLRNLIFKPPVLCYFALSTKGIALYKDLILVIILKLFRVKIIYHLHNKGIDGNLLRYLAKLCYQFIFHNSRIIILSPRLYNDIKKIVPFTNVSICANGIALNRLDDVGRVSIPQIDHQRAVRILFLSNLFESKGVFVLLEALSILRRRNLDFICDIVGPKGDIDADHLMQYVNKLCLEQNVVYHGKRTGSEKDLLLGAADIFAFPSFYESECFPMVLLEAMNFYLPIISTFEGGIPDMIVDGETGFLVMQKDVMQLSEKLELLINSADLRNSMGKNGRQRLEKLFTIEKFEQTMCSILTNAIVNR